MAGHGTVHALPMESRERGRATEWMIRLLLLALAVAAVWTVFGDDIAQFVGR